MFKNILRSELKKLQYAKLLKVLAIVLIGLALMYVLSLWVMQLSLSLMNANIPPDQDPFTMASLGLGPESILSFFAVGSVGFFTITFSAVIAAYLGKEYKTTLRQTMIVVDDRKKYYFVKLIVIFSLLFIFIVLATLINTIVYGLFSGFDAITFTNTGNMLLAATALVTLMFGIVSLLMMITAVTKHRFNIVLLTIGVGFVFEILFYILGGLENKIFYDILSFFPTNLLALILVSEPQTKYIVGGFIIGISFLIIPTIIGAKVIEKQDI